jgi:hypothetical protein
MPIPPVPSPVESILRAWLEEPEVTLFCGDWTNGGVMELLPSGPARLSEPRYDPPFEGVREIRPCGGSHHIHLDLARLTHAWYVLTPSVCYDFRPSFELRLGCAGSRPLSSFGLGLALSRPYAGDILRREAVQRYLMRAGEHLSCFPDAVSVICNRGDVLLRPRADWESIDALLEECDDAMYPGLRSLRSALTDPGASS